MHGKENIQMTNIYIDFETQGLNAKKPIMAGIWKEGQKKPKIYIISPAKETWKQVIKEKEAARKRNKTINIYSHNAQYDTAAYIPLNDKHIHMYSQRPFIWNYQEKGKPIIYFLDTYNIFRMSLEKLGEILDMPKGQTPKKLKEEEPQIYELKEIMQIEEYMKQDIQIMMKAINELKKRLKRDKVNIKRLITIHQIAIQYILKKIAELPKEYTEPIFWNKEKLEIRQTWREKEIHASLRGGRNEAFRIGTYQDQDYIDINSLYPYASTQIRFPDLKSERRIDNPIKKGQTIKEITEEIGISRACVKNINNEHKLLQIRTKEDTYLPGPGNIMIGTWTNQELKKASEEGYEILDIEWTIKYEEAQNPFKIIMPELYKKRKETKDKLDDYLYKSYMNSSLGKFAQRKTEQEIVIDSVEEAKEYLKKNYKMINSMDKDGKGYYFYKNEKKAEQMPRKKYYAPIITSLIYAQARIKIYEELKKVPIEEITYTDTDSIIMNKGHLEKFDIGEGLGQFKIEGKGQKALIYSRKTYSIGEQIKLGGINKRDIKKEEFEKGKVSYRTQITIKTTKDIEKVGEFRTETRDLKEQEEKHKRREEMMKEQKLHIDYDIENINYFYKTLDNVLR